MKNNRRRIRLINPRLQWKFVLSFTAIACAAVTFEALVVNRLVIRAAGRLPRDGDLLIAEATNIMLLGLGATLLVLVPAAVAFGVVATFRVAGPLFAMRRHLDQVARGENPGRCHIRREDELHDFCDSLNAAMDALRADDDKGDAVSTDGTARSAMRLVS